MEFPSSDNNLPNDDAVYELVFDGSCPKGDYSEDDIVRIKQWLLEGMPKMVHEESDKQSIMKEDDTILNHKTESARNNSDGIPMDPAACSDAILTPETSPQKWYDLYSDIPTVVPTPYITSDPVSQPDFYAHNQPMTSASIQPANAPEAYVPGQRAPPNQLMKTPTVDNFGTQRIQGVQATPTSSTLYEPLPVDIEEQVFGLPSGNYFSALHLVRPEPSSVIIGQQPSSQCLDQNATIPAQKKTAQQEVIVQPSTSTGSPNSKKNTQIPYGTFHICDICNSRYSTRGNLNQHLAIKHKDYLPFRCDICGEIFRTWQTLYRHRLGHDPSKRSYKCESCEKIYRHRGDLRSHFRKKHGKPPFECEIKRC